MRMVYSVVRFVPDPARGEFINVGVIVGSEESLEWQVRQLDNSKRARQIDEHESLDAAWGFLDWLGRQTDSLDRYVNENLAPGESPALSEAWLRELYERHRNVVQLTEPTPMSADSLDEAIERISHIMLLEPETEKRSYKTKHAAFAAVNHSYKSRSLERFVKVFQRPTLQTPHHRQRLDFAVANGKVVQLTHTWSFQVPDQATLADQVKSWGWTMSDLQESGGELQAEAVRLHVDPTVDVEVVYIPPESADAPAFQDALAVFEKLKTTHYPIDKADHVGEAAARLIGSDTGQPL